MEIHCDVLYPLIHISRKMSRYRFFLKPARLHRSLCELLCEICAECGAGSHCVPLNRNRIKKQIPAYNLDDISFDSIIYAHFILGINGPFGEYCRTMEYNSRLSREWHDLGTSCFRIHIGILVERHEKKVVLVKLTGALRKGYRLNLGDGYGYGKKQNRYDQNDQYCCLKDRKIHHYFITSGRKVLCLS